MSYRFDFTVTASFTELRLIGPDGPLPIRDWALQASHNLTQGVNLVHRLQADDQAFGNDDEPTFSIAHRAIARLSPYEASLLGLPPLAEVVAAITSQGLSISQILQSHSSGNGRTDRRLCMPNAAAHGFGSAKCGNACWNYSLISRKK